MKLIDRRVPRCVCLSAAVAGLLPRRWPGVHRANILPKKLPRVSVNVNAAVPVLSMELEKVAGIAECVSPSATGIAGVGGCATPTPKCCNSCCNLLLEMRALAGALLCLLLVHLSRKLRGGGGGGSDAATAISSTALTVVVRAEPLRAGNDGTVDAVICMADAGGDGIGWPAVAIAVAVVVVSGCFCRGLAYSGVVTVRADASGLLTGVCSAQRADIAAEAAARVACTTAGGGGGGGGSVVDDGGSGSAVIAVGLCARAAHKFCLVSTRTCTITPGRSGHFGGLFGISGGPEGPVDFDGDGGVDGGRCPTETGETAGRSGFVALVEHSKSLRA